MGIVEPGTTKLVKVVFKAHRAYTDDLRFCKERFLIQSIVVDHTLAEHAISTNLFKSGQRQEAKLKILIVSILLVYFPGPQPLAVPRPFPLLCTFLTIPCLWGLEADAC